MPPELVVFTPIHIYRFEAKQLPENVDAVLILPMGKAQLLGKVSIFFSHPDIAVRFCSLIVQTDPNSCTPFFLPSLSRFVLSCFV